MTRAYRRLARELHPDVNPSTTSTTCSAGSSRARAGRAGGRDVETEVELEFEAAVRGATVKVGSAPVRVPAGIEDGQMIRIPGQGGDGRDGGPRGDLYVTVRAAPHRLFGRQGANLTLRVPARNHDAEARST